jgi:CrcB protein
MDMTAGMPLGAAVAAAAAGAGLGGLARWRVSEAVARRTGGRFPWGTLTVNISGCLLLGAFGAAATTTPGFASPALWLFGAGGFLGSYTTVSSFSLQTLELLQMRAFGRAALNVALSLVLCLGATWLGWQAARAALGAAV